jgi:6-pyruvoyltetrahydropterin/6-carboxytetrahydropterin synthase
MKNKLMVFVTRVEHFNAAHKLWNPDWSPEKNKEVFGKCANENYHGHNYELHVTVKGEPAADTGFVMNAKELGTIIKQLIVDEADHKNLNIDVPFMSGRFTSAEMFAIGIWEQLQPAVAASGAALHCVKLIETPKIYVEYYG